MTDPFRHHPNLRDKVKPFAQSFFRDKTTDDFKAMTAAMGLPDTYPYYDDTKREALRAKVLSGHEGDLLVFAYGSLIWDPAIDFAEVRRAHAPQHARRFMLVDIHGARGTQDAPGLMAALDDGPGCDGVVFRIAADKVVAETRQLCQRELIGPGYHARMIPVLIDGDAAQALTFVADHDDQAMWPDITRADQIRFAATGAGMLGTSFDYLRSTVGHLAEVGIDDPDATALLAEVEAYRKAL